MIKKFLIVILRKLLLNKKILLKFVETLKVFFICYRTQRLMIR